MPEIKLPPPKELQLTGQPGEPTKTVNNGRRNIFIALSAHAAKKLVIEPVIDMGKGFNRAWAVSDGRDAVTRTRDFFVKKLWRKNQALKKSA